MKRKRKQSVQVPAHLFGLENVLGGLLGGAGAANGGLNLAGLLGGSGATGASGLASIAGGGSPIAGVAQAALPAVTSSLGLGEDASTVINDVGSMGLTGLSVGGPIGGAVGAGVGLVKGLFGIGSNKRRRERIRREKRRQENVKIQGQLQDMSDEMATDYYQDNEIIPTFENGGIMNSNLAYLDHNEMVRTPDGELTQVQSNNPTGTDNILTNLPEGSSILSDELKVPGTKKTFANAGKVIERRFNKGSNNTGYFAENTSKLNKLNMNREIDNLVSLQESVKKEKDIKPKYKNIVPAYASGNLGFRFTPPTDPSELAINEADLDQIRYGGLRSSRYVTVPTIATPGINPRTQLAGIVDPNTGIMPSTRTTNTSSGNGLNLGSGNSIANGLSNIFTDYMALSPVNYNFRKGNESVEVASPIENPYASRISSTMANRRFNINPAIERNRISTNIGNYNANAITNSGQNMAFRLANTVAERRANNDLFNQANNVNQGYASDYASTLNNLGQQSMSARTTSEDINRRNRAARDQYTATAHNQMSQWAQNKQLMNNSKGRDQQRMGIWNILAKYGLNEKDLSSINVLMNQ